MPLQRQRSGAQCRCSVSEAALNAVAASAKRRSMPLQRQRSGAHEVQLKDEVYERSLFI